MAEPDFTNRRYFPGTTGNTFDVVLHVAEIIDRIPLPLFGALLLGLAILVTRAHWLFSFGLWGFMLLDWLLVGLLPRAGKSYGPPQPPVLILSVARAVMALLPLAVALPAQIVGTLLVVYGFWIEPHRLTLTRQKLVTNKLAAGRTLRVLHLGDIHVERVTGRERRLNRMIKELSPDLILFSGDFLNLSYREDPQAVEEVREILKEWAAPLGVFAVTGSPAVDLPEAVPHILDGLPLRWLKDERVTISFEGQPVDLIGLTCSHKPFLDGPRLKSLLAEKPEHFTLLLYHTPDLAPQAAEAGVDLQLSGHTHGGQVRLPFYGALFTGSLYGKRFEAGRVNLEGLTLYVTRGIGMEGAGAPRVRFLCPPEIILWEISGSTKA